MSLTWKDGITTLLAFLVAGLYFARTTSGMQLSLISDGYRWAIIALAVIGIGMCSFSSPATTSGTNMFIVLAGILGVSALILIIYGLVTGAKIAFTLLAMTILSLWLIATVRHLFAW